jgi:hypothetical protein
MSTNIKVDKTLINIAAKKALGKAHTATIAQTQNETIPSNVQVSAETTFGQSVPNTVNTDTFYSIQSGTVEYIEFDVAHVVGSDYDEDDYSGYGGSENSSDTHHGYYLKLPSNYVASSSNPNKNTGFFANSQRIYDTRGKLQLVPPFLSNAASNKYNLKLYDQTNTRIMPGDSIDWTIDYYNGIVFVQDPNTSKVPTKARAFLYIGKMTSTVISEAGGQITVKDEGSNITTAASSFNFVGASVVASNSGNDVTVTLSSDVFSRTAVTSTTTSSVSDKILGVSASAAIDIRLPAASGFTGGQSFTIKDEAGNANINNITIKTAGSDTIDGQSSIMLESPYSAVNLYSNGSNKFFIY